MNNHKVHTNVYNINAADKIKELISEIGWDGITKDEETRNLMSMMYDYATNHGDIPLHEMINKIIRYAEHGSCIVFVHIRKKSEIDKFIMNININSMLHRIMNRIYIHKLLIRSSHTVTADNDNDNDVANADDGDYNTIIHNDGSIHDLYNKVDKFIDCFGGNVR